MNRRPPAHRATSPPLSASPAATSTGTGKLCGSTAPSTAGGTVRCVTACRVSTPERSGPGSSSAARAITSTAPLLSATTSSATDASNPGDANASTRLPSRTANRSACAATRLPSPACETTTPFGAPVDPDV